MLVMQWTRGGSASRGSGVASRPWRHSCPRPLTLRPWSDQQSRCKPAGRVSYRCRGASAQGPWAKAPGRWRQVQDFGRAPRRPRRSPRPTRRPAPPPGPPSTSWPWGSAAWRRPHRPQRGRISERQTNREKERKEKERRPGRAASEWSRASSCGCGDLVWGALLI